RRPYVGAPWKLRRIASAGQGLLLRLLSESSTFAVPMVGRKGAGLARQPRKTNANGEDEIGLPTGESRAARLRVRAAWMYFIEQMTQTEIADVLGIGRVSVVRMLAEARARSEVKISIESELVEVVRLERALEKTFGLQQALVAPLSAGEADP